MADERDRFEIQVEHVDVTSLSRPDTSWHFVDAHGHVHQWHVDGKPATMYSPVNKHSLPTLTWIVDEPATDDYPESGHYECATCGERVTPARMADTDRQFVPGLRRFYINNRPVSPEEFERRAKEAGYL